MMKESKTQSTIVVGVIYLLAFLVLYFGGKYLHSDWSMIYVLKADVIATLIVFLFSYGFKNSSIYDPYWSVVPPVIVIYLMGQFPQGNAARQLIILALVLFWSIRLTLNWLRGWNGLKHEDWRYGMLAEKTGKAYWLISFLGIHLMPTLLVFAGSLTFWYSLSSTKPLNALDFFAALLTLFAIIIEWRADEQLKQFKKNQGNQAYISSGLWSLSRHPNYFGEIAFWFGLFLFVVSSGSTNFTNGLWTAIGFISMYMLFRFISIPMMEKRNTSRKKGYVKYMEKTPILVPGIGSRKK